MSKRLLNRLLLAVRLRGIAFFSTWLVTVLAYLMLTRTVPTGRERPMPQERSPVTGRLVWIVVDGLRADFAFNPGVMPALNRLASKGASGIANADGITLSLPAIVAWTAGTDFKTADMIRNFWGASRELDSIFRAAHEVGLRVAFSGPPDWPRSFGDYSKEFFTHDNRGGDTARNDRESHEHVLEFLASARADIVVVHYIDADMVAHKYGARSKHYATALGAIDGYLAEVLSHVPSDTTILVTSDHGTTDEGFHWEAAPEVVRTAVVLAGTGIVPGTGFEVHAKDLAPTLAALLGVRFPSQSVGTIRHELLAASLLEKARWEVGYAGARLHAFPAGEAGVPELTGSYDRAVTRLREARFQEAIDLSRQVQRGCTSLYRSLERRQTRPYFAAALVIGAGVMALLVFHLTRDAGGKRFPLLAASGSLLAAGVVWTLSGRVHSNGEEILWPFRYPFLAQNWEKVLLALIASSLLLALLSRKLTLRCGERWSALAVSFLALMLGSFWQPHDIYHWTLAVAVLLLVWRAILFEHRLIPWAALLAATFAASLVARRANTLFSWFGARAGVGLAVLAFSALTVTFVSLTRLFRGDPDENRRWSGVGALLAVLAGVTVVARYNQWERAQEILIVFVAAIAFAALRTRPAPVELRSVHASLALMALMPLLYPLYYTPFVALVIIGLACLARAVDVRYDPGAFRPTLVVLTVTLLLFFGLSGDFDLRSLDTKRLQLLSPAFDYDYSSVIRIGALNLVQLSLAPLAVLVWLGYSLRQRKDLWTRVDLLVHLFFVTQLVGLVVAFRSMEYTPNGPRRNLSCFIFLLALYLAYYFAGLVSERWSFPREGVGATDLQTERVNGACEAALPRPERGS